MSTLVLTAAIVLAAPPAKQSECHKLVQNGQLVYTQLRDSKSCGPSRLLPQWVDCTYKVGASQIRLAGATTGTPEARAKGADGEGFYIEGIEARTRLRVRLHPQHGLVVELRGNTQCVHDVAYVLLDGTVRSPAARKLLKE